MTWLVALAALVLVIALAAGALPAAGYWWEVLGALGFCAFAVIAFLGWDSESPASGARLQGHRNLGIVAAGLAAAHAGGYLATDSTVVEYLLPAAPAYMLAGIGAFVLLLGMTLTSLPGPRRASYPGFAAFRRWHRGLFLGLLILTGWHVLGTGYSLRTLWQGIALAAVLGLLPTVAYRRRRRGQSVPVTPAPGNAAAADAGAVLAALGLGLLSAAFGAFKQLACEGC